MFCKKYFITLTVLYFITIVPCMANRFWHNIQLTARIGYNLSGTVPFGLPASIRSLEGYKMPNNSVLELNASMPIDENWAWSTALRFENKDMLVDAKVKNYHLSIVQGEKTQAGMFTGYVHTEVRQWMATLPLQLSYRLNHYIRLRGGLYASYLLTKSFSGNAYNGYLRIGSPIGPKLELGSELGTRGEYDFSSFMRSFQFGAITGIDCHVYRRIGVYADINWGFTGIHKRSFKMIEQTLYPVYGTIGLSYQLK